MKKINLGLFMACLVAFAVLVSITSMKAKEKDLPEDYCQKLEDVIRIALDKFIAGDTTSRVDVALAAHMRLQCSPVNLLTVLDIR